MNSVTKKIASIVILCSVSTSFIFTCDSPMLDALGKSIDVGFRVQQSCPPDSTSAKLAPILVPITLFAITGTIVGIIFLLSHATEGSDDAALADACSHNDLPKIERIINRGENLNLGKALRKACVSSRFDVVKLLIEKGADVNSQSTDTQNTALHKACYWGRREKAKYLIDHGANLEAESTCHTWGPTPLHTAYKLLFHHRYRENDFFDIVKYLIENGANINAKEISRYENAILHIACREGNIQHVRYFVTHGADINIQNVNEATPLHIACQHGHIDIIEYLIAQGADINKAASSNRKPIHYACSRGHIDVTRLLIQHGANLQETCYEANPKNPVQLINEYTNSVTSRQRRRVNIDDIELLKEQQAKQKQVLHLLESQPENIQQIKELIKDYKSTTCARQAALPILVEAHRNNNASVTEPDLKELFAKTKFNYRFFQDEKFAEARIFAQNNEVKDSSGKTFEAARKIFVKKKQKI